MGDTEEILKLEAQTVKRVERLEVVVQEIREDVAGLPGKLIQVLGQREKTDKTWQWAFGLILTALGAGFLLLHNQDANLRSEVSGAMKSVGASIHDHTRDKHPTRVEGDLREVSTKLKAHIHHSESEYLRRQEYEQQNGEDKLKLAKDLATAQIQYAAALGEMQAKQELILRATIEAMKLGGAAGRGSAENRGRVDAELKSLQQQLENSNAKSNRQ